MPTYQYACTACGHRLEAVQSFSDSALTECPECAGKLRKLFGSVGVVFKGSGFYRTDSRNGSTASSPAASGSETKSETKTETKSESKTESKPAAKAEKSSSSAPAKAAAN